MIELYSNNNAKEMKERPNERPYRERRGIYVRESLFYRSLNYFY